MLVDFSGCTGTFHRVFNWKVRDCSASLDPSLGMSVVGTCFWLSLCDVHDRACRPAAAGAGCPARGCAGRSWTLSEDAVPGGFRFHLEHAVFFASPEHPSSVKGQRLFHHLSLPPL